RGQFTRVLFRAAAAMQDVENAPAVRQFADAGGYASGQVAMKGGEGVPLDDRGDVAQVVRVPPIENRQVAGDQRVTRSGKRSGALVPDERVVGDQIRVAGGDGSLAEVVLLAIAGAEGLDVEAADRPPDAPADEHAEADAGRHFGILPL